MQIQIGLHKDVTGHPFTREHVKTLAANTVRGRGGMEYKGISPWPSF